MNEYIERLKVFYRRNRIFIITILSFSLLLQICSLGAQVDADENKTDITEHEEMPSYQQNRELSPIDSAIYRTMNKYDNDSGGNSLLMQFLLMTGLVFAFYIMQRRGLLEKILPQKVSVRTSLVDNKDSGETLLNLEIINKTKDSITFDPPVITFKRFSKTRSFRIKGNNGEALFPLTLTPGTSHKLVVNIERIKNNIPELEKYKSIFVTVKADNGKIYQSKPGGRFF